MNTRLGWWPSIQMVLLRNSPGGVDVDRCHCNNIQSWWVSHSTLENVTYLFTRITAPCRAEELHHIPAQEPGSEWESWASALSWLAETVLSNIAESKPVLSFSLPSPLTVWFLAWLQKSQGEAKLCSFIYILHVRWHVLIGRAAPLCRFSFIENSLPKIANI